MPWAVIPASPVPLPRLSGPGRSGGCPGLPVRPAASQAGRTPDREPPAEVSLDLEVVGERAPDLHLQRVVPALAGQRREGVEGAALVQVDPPQAAALVVGEGQDRA